MRKYLRENLRQVSKEDERKVQPFLVLFCRFEFASKHKGKINRLVEEGIKK
jgi:hypothetical protein